MSLISALAVIGIPFSFFLWLASLSLVGALIAGALAVGFIYLVARGAGHLAKKYVPPFVESMLRPYYALTLRGQAPNATKEVLVAKMANGEEGEELRGKLVQFQAQHSGFPPVPTDYLQYEGWFKEIKKRVRFESMRLTREEEIRLGKTVNELQSEWIRYYQLRRELGLEKELSEQRAAAETKRVSNELKNLEVESLELDAKLRALQPVPPQQKKEEPRIDRILRQRAEQEAERDKLIEAVRKGRPDSEITEEEQEEIGNIRNIYADKLRRLYE